MGKKGDKKANRYEWWNKEETSEEQLQARVVLIFKKGVTSDLDNYRPIFLLNSTYKILAAIIQRRLASTMDQKLQKIKTERFWYMEMVDMVITQKMVFWSKIQKCKQFSPAAGFRKI